MSQTTVILTGMRVNNNLHIGNLLGAVKPMVDMATSNHDAQINLFVPDLHSITTDFDKNKIKDLIIDNIRTAVAYGLPLEKPNVFIYRQSYVPAHSELTWILDCFTGFGELSRMIEFKEKSEAAGKTNVGVGLFNYPVLMAADILLYDASYVPVGDDQRQHLEFARNIATKFNSKFGDIFVVPKNTKQHAEQFKRDQAPRIKDLLDPSKKMSKSAVSDKGIIFLNDSVDDVRSKIMSATTDSLGSINYDHDNQPGISNLLDIMHYLTNQTIEDLVKKYKDTTSYAGFKSDVADIVCSFLTEFQNKLKTADDVQILQKLESSEIAMNKQANSKLHSVQKAVGLR